MKKIRLLFLCLCLFLTAACDKEQFATGVADQPILSTDTLAMGTVLGNNSSKTYLIKLYNHSSGTLCLSSIRLRHAAQSGFRMNVDGMNGTEFTNIDLLHIAKGDSLFILVEATFETDPDDPEIIPRTDYIEITCNNRTQTVVLTASSLNVERLGSVVIASDTTWTTQGLAKQIMDSLIILPGAKLTLRQGVTVYMHNKAGIRVSGTLQCLGTADSIVTLRGDRMDKLFSNLTYDELPSQWGTLVIENTAHDCQFVHTDIHGMTQGIKIDSTDVLFQSCHIRNSDGNLISCRMSQVRLYNSLLSNAALSLLEVFGGHYEIVHCTLANFNFNKRITQQTVRLSNMDAANGRYTPLDTCAFVNTIIWGRKFNPDVQADYHKVPLGKDGTGRMQYADSVFCYSFDHCLIRKNGEDSEGFYKNIWNDDPQFKVTDESTYSFDFHLQPSSPAIGAGSPEGATLCPLDLDGNPRKETPTIGCYE